MPQVPARFKKFFRISSKGERKPSKRLVPAFPDFKVFETGNKVIGYRSPIGGIHGQLIPGNRAKAIRKAIPSRGTSLAKRELRIDLRKKTEKYAGPKAAEKTSKQVYVTKEREAPWREIENTARAEKYFGDIALRVHGFEINKVKDRGKIFFNRVPGKALSKINYSKLKDPERLDLLAKCARVMKIIHEGKLVEGKYLSMQMGDFKMKNIIWDQTASNGVRLVDLENATFSKKPQSIQGRLNDMLDFLGSAKFRGLVKNYYDMELFTIFYLNPKFRIGDKLDYMAQKEIIELKGIIGKEVPKRKRDKNVQNLAPLFR